SKLTLLTISLASGSWAKQTGASKRTRWVCLLNLATILLRNAKMLSAAEFQAWLRSGPRVRFGLSGDTPGDRVELAFRRVSLSCEKTQTRSRRVRPLDAPPPICDAESCSATRACFGISQWRSFRRRDGCAS